MVSITISLGALFISTAILLMGNGLQGTLVIVRGGLEQFTPEALGILTSAYYGGFLLDRGDGKVCKREPQESPQCP